jgi:hypothetical protein
MDNNEQVPANPHPLPEQVPAIQTEEKSITQLLRELPGSPVQETIDQWKTLHGEVLVAGFSEEEVYIFRPLKRPEYVEMQTMIAAQGLNQLQQQEIICSKCVLWPTGVNWNEGKAGTVHTLHEQIMMNSNFLSPAVASMLVEKL